MPNHNLRTNPVPFQDVWKDLQTFQIRPDRDYEVGDTIILQETIFETEQKSDQEICQFTGREVHALITHIMRGPKYGLEAGWVCMSIKTYFKSKLNIDHA